MIRRLLIANRGEIARRVIRTCREMRIESVAVYSDADTAALHVQEADASKHIGPAPARESYLNIARVVDAARRAGADAVHPGYGFLSENPDFAAACEQAGLIFVGPPAAVMRRMGSKTGARAIAEHAGVPVVPGAIPASQSVADIEAAIRKVGLPVLIKAAAGGGGKGMRTIRRHDEIADGIRAAKSEAARSFGRDDVYIERLVDEPRHIEVQVFGDTTGQVVHLFERDCSLQRRHQKVIEEAPAPRLSPAVRHRLLDAGVAAAKAVGYVNAGTVEFLVEGEGEHARFYFLEMNMRLQVEHPITEAITGLDLVRAQILVASGEPLPFSQADITASGHAMECRVYAEDSERLLPQAGKVLLYREPSGEGLRVDSGVAAGQSVTVNYDPMLAKVIVHAATRGEAMSRVRDALSRYDILGLRHNVAFLLKLLDRSEVRDARTQTRFIDEHFAELTAPPDADLQEAAAALAAFVRSRPSQDAGEAPAHDPWDLIGPVIW